MATNWDSILSNTNNLNDVLSILKKILAQMGDANGGLIGEEIVFNTTNPSLNINNGTIQILTLIEDGTLIASLQSGQSMTLLIDLNGFNLNIPFKKTQDFTLTNGGKNLCVLFKIGDDVYITSGGAFL
ncbi:hypothetical protein [Acinetobacter sp. ANC 4177]|uniref:hypothetical protein n=1 Tax=Acinetobacter sp. ANC 4177 TaxID=2529838 RepID=UPI0010387B0B|nr:hypothetical protein [Acinetobacter sp. ANC 4177]TCB73189.1 hypothetical protein E0H91_13870 [Acinetobacter sp. ANC 4177]